VARSCNPRRGTVLTPPGRRQLVLLKLRSLIQTAGIRSNQHTLAKRCARAVGAGWFRRTHLGSVGVGSYRATSCSAAHATLLNLQRLRCVRFRRLRLLAPICVAFVVLGLGFSAVASVRGGVPLRWSSPIRVAPGSLYDISCPTASLCVAIDNVGDVVTSTRPASGTSPWAAFRLAETAANGVSCPLVSLCLAPGSDGSMAISTRPAGGQSAWSPTQVLPPPNLPPGSDGGSSVLSAVSCAGRSLCIAVGYYVTCYPSSHGMFCGQSAAGDAVTTDPTGGVGAWKITNFGGGILTSVSCPSRNLCVGVAPGGAVVSSTNPTGGSSAWRTVEVAEPPDGSGIGPTISCASASLCVAVNGAGTLISSSDPAGRAAAWRVASLGTPLTAVSCPAMSLCVAVNNAGQEFTSTRPNSGSSSWTPTNIDPGDALLGVSCPSVLLCIATDPVGRVIVGNGPTSRQIRSLLAHTITPRRKHLIHALIRNDGYSLSFSAPSTGQATVNWYSAAHPGRLTKALLIAKGQGVFSRAGNVRIEIKLTRKGQTLLAHRNHLKLIAQGTFTPTGSTAVTYTSKFTIYV
jgi:hypothetical protein